MKRESEVQQRPGPGTALVVFASRFRQGTAAMEGLRWSTWLALAALFIIWGVNLPNLYWYQVLTLFLFYAILTLSMDLIAGRTGQLSLGQAGFVALGAYSEAMGQTWGHLDAWVSFLIAVVVGGLAGLLIATAVSKLRGFYLAMVTVGFAEVVTQVIQLFPNQTGGASGLSNFGSLPFPGTSTGLQSTYFAAVLVLMVALAANVAFSNRYASIASGAVRDRIEFAKAIGVNVPRLKVITFVVSGGIAAASGAIYASALTYISPDVFTLNMSIFVLVAAVAGGLGTTYGPILGIALIYGFQQETASYSQYALLFYAALLIVVPLLFVRGIGGTAIDALRNALTRATRRSSQANLDNGEMGKVREGVSRERPSLRLRLEGIAVHFGGVKAVDNVSIDVASQETVGLIGPNGAGKTTLLQTISGFYTPTFGKIIAGEQDITKLPMYVRARQGIITTFQEPQLLMAETVRTNIASGCLAAPGGGYWRSRRKDRKEVERVADELDLTPFLDAKAGSLSGGHRKVVELARGLISLPAILLLDEPGAGLSEGEISILVKAIRILKKRGVTMVVCDHRLEVIVEVCDRVIVLDNGKILAEGTFDEVIQNALVAEAYLGDAPGVVDDA